MVRSQPLPVQRWCLGGCESSSGAGSFSPAWCASSAAGPNAARQMFLVGDAAVVGAAAVTTLGHAGGSGHGPACSLQPRYGFLPFFPPSLPFYQCKKAAVPMAALMRHIGLCLPPPERGRARQDAGCRARLGRQHTWLLGAAGFVLRKPCTGSPRRLLRGPLLCPGRHLAHLLMGAHTKAMQSQGHEQLDATSAPAQAVGKEQGARHGRH